MSNPCPYRPPPAGVTPWPASQTVSDAILAWARANLHYPMGAIVQENVGGQPVVARLECHFHPPGGSIKPWGPHKGCTIYWPTAPITPGVVMPVTLDPMDAQLGQDPWVEAGTQWYDSSPPTRTDWPLVIVSGVAILATAAAFMLALKLAGRPRLP